MSDCEWTEQRLGAWLDGELEPAEARRVMAHVERCAACERRRLLLNEAGARLRELGTVMLASAPAPVVAPARTRRFAWIAAAAALLALVTGFAWAERARSKPALADECAHCGPEPFPIPSASTSLARTPAKP
jgi:anti-sigma factor RsiW